jgi:hypothetical protein
MGKCFLYLLGSTALVKANGPFNLVVGGCQRHSSGRGFNPRLGVKKISLTNFTQITWSRPGQSSWVTGSCVQVGKTHVSKHKLRTDPWATGPVYEWMWGSCGFLDLRENASSCGSGHSPTDRVFLEYTNKKRLYILR